MKLLSESFEIVNMFSKFDLELINYLKTKAMKKNLIAGLLLFSGVIFAQNVEPKYEIVGNLVKATYYYDNGQLKQEGFYKDAKPHGKWASFNEDGSKQAIGEYADGQKTGKWFFWNKATLSEVDYSNSRISDIKNWKQEALVNRN